MHYPTCSSTGELCNNFADFFQEKIETIRHKLDTLPRPDTSDFERLENIELSGIVRKFSSKSCSLDPVPPSLLSYCLDDLLSVIRKIVNLSFDSATVPSSMKHAVLSPPLKKQSFDFEVYPNFRPISNSKFLSKVLEKVAAVRLCDYLDQLSCKTALLRVQSDILEAIDNRQCVVLLLLDLSAAFDTVDHATLLHRLQLRFGINGKALQWFHSYLTGRSHSYK